MRRVVDRQSGEERADDIRQVNGSSKDTGHGHNPKHQDEIGVIVILHLLQDVRSGATQAKQNKRNKDRDLDKLQRKAGDRKAALISGNADCEYDQR